jgi:hypothetical protein
MVRDWDTGTLYTIGAEGIGKYAQYTDNGESYVMQYSTPQMDFGDPAAFKFLKKVRPIIIGSTDSNATLNWTYDFEIFNEGSETLPVKSSSATPKWGEARWDDAVWALDTSLNILNINTTGSGAHVKVGITAEINGAEFSIQELTTYATLGRKVW